MRMLSLRELWKEKEFRRVILLFILVKIFVVAIAISVQFIVPPEITHTQKITNWVLNPFSQYDSTAYLDIAQNGYNPEFNAGGIYTSPPSYPLSIGMLDVVDYSWPALLMANFANRLYEKRIEGVPVTIA